VRVDFDPGYVAPRHAHFGEEIIYVLEGTLVYEVEGRPPTTYKAGDVLIVPGGRDPLGEEHRPWQRCGARAIDHGEKEASVERAIRKTSLTLAAVFVLTTCASASTRAGDADRIRAIERERLRSLVDADMKTAERLHADDFQLINPAGTALTKVEYLGSLKSGQLDYLAWEPGDIAVRLYGNAAVIRYRDLRFEVARDGKVIHRGPMVHTNLYEMRNGQWRVVWSQASGVITPP